MSDVSITIDLDGGGDAQGHIEVPSSTNDSGWRNEFIPVATFGDPDADRAAVVFGGTHGDEFEGQIAVQRLARALIEGDERARTQLILVPSLSMPACRQGTRLWPDGTNMNRVFPGDPDGSPSQRLAHFLVQEIFPRVHHVFDIHSGGRSMHFFPMSHMRRVEDVEQGKLMLDAMKAWNSDLHMLYTNIAGTGLLPDTASDMGKVVVTTELGGGGYIDPATHQLAQAGLRNSLRSIGVLEGEARTRADLGMEPATIVRALARENYLLAPQDGILEVVAAPGQAVRHGDVVARIHRVEHPWAAPAEITSPKDGYVCTVRAPALTRQGDCACVVGEVVDEAEIWDDPDQQVP